MQGVARRDSIVLIQNHIAADRPHAVLKHDAGGFVDGRCAAGVPAVADGSTLIAFPIDICGTGSIYNAAGNGDAAGAAGGRVTGPLVAVLIPTAAANACGIAGLLNSPKRLRSTAALPSAARPLRSEAGR